MYSDFAATAAKGMKGQRISLRQGAQSPLKIRGSAFNYY